MKGHARLTDLSKLIVARKIEPAKVDSLSPHWSPVTPRSGLSGRIRNSVKAVGAVGADEQTTDLSRGKLFVRCPYFVDPQFVRTLEPRVATQDGNADHRHSIAVELVYVPFKVLASAGVCEILEWDLWANTEKVFMSFSWLRTKEGLWIYIPGSPRSYSADHHGNTVGVARDLYAAYRWYVS